jgi:hypothetical protein
MRRRISAKLGQRRKCGGDSEIAARGVTADI